MKSIHLTPGEEKVFASLPEELRKDWKIESEVLRFEDSPERRKIRFETMDLSGDGLAEFKTRANSVSTEEEFMKLVESFDVTSIPEGDLTQVVFALGPDFMGVFISDLLKAAKTSQDVEVAAAFAGLRHGMLESLNRYFAPTA